MTNLNLLKEAREIVRCQPMSIPVGHLKTCADQLGEAYDLLKISCTREYTRNFVAAYTRTLIAIERVQAHTPPTPTGGRLSLPQQREEKAVTSSL